MECVIPLPVSNVLAKRGMQLRRKGLHIRDERVKYSKVLDLNPQTTMLAIQVSSLNKLAGK